MTTIKEGADWVEIHDEAITAVSLIAEIDSRVKQRREQHGRITPHFPTFGQTAVMPEPPAPHEAPALYHHLRQLNALEGPPVTAVLTPSPVTQLPVIGRLWQFIRRQAHDLVLFYVNRAAAYHYQTHNQLISTLNELVRLTQQQQAEISQLQAKIEMLPNKD